MTAQLGVRWTIGDVSSAGFEALRLSVHGAMRLFGKDVTYRVYVNTISISEARRRVGPLGGDLEWHATERRIPDILRPFLSDGMAEGVAWKLIPLRAFPGRFELSLDNDVILWDIPPALSAWLDPGERAARLIAADVSAGHGNFSKFCGPAPRNSGIRGLGPEFDFEGALQRILQLNPVPLDSELDEQGLQVAALSVDGPPLVVNAGDVTICSPFYPHTPALGRFGAHFVGLNARVIPWFYYEKPAIEVRLAHWNAHRPELYRRVGLAMPDLPELAP
jgi:hypothetical protein